MTRRREAKARGDSRERVGGKLGETIFEKLKSRKLEMPQISEEDKKQKAAGKQYYRSEKLGGGLYNKSRRGSLNALKM